MLKINYMRCAFVVGALLPAVAFTSGCSGDPATGADGDETSAEDADDGADGTGGTDDAGTGGTGNGTNLACIVDADCGVGFNCVLGECTAGCQDDSDCADGETCDVHGNCESAIPQAPDPFPNSPVGALQLLETETFVEAGSGTIVVTTQIENASSEPLRFRMQSGNVALEHEIAPVVVDGGAIAELSVTIDRDALDAAIPRLPITVITDAGNTEWFLNFERELTGFYTGVFAFSEPAFLGGTGVGLNLAFDDSGAVSGQLISEEGLHFSSDLAVSGTLDGDALHLEFADVVPAGAGDDQSPFGRDVGREFSLDGTLDLQAGSFEGLVSERLTGLADTALVVTGAASLSRAGESVEDLGAPVDFASQLPVAVPVSGFDDVLTISECQVLSSGGIAGVVQDCSGCVSGTCATAEACMADIAGVAHSVEAILADEDSPSSQVWGDCVDAPQSYSGGQACHDAAALRCAVYLGDGLFQEPGQPLPERRQDANRTLDAIAALSAGANLIALEKEIGALLAYRDTVLPSEALATENQRIEEALELVETPLRLVAAPGFYRLAATVGPFGMVESRDARDLRNAVDLAERYTELKTIQLRSRARSEGVNDGLRQELAQNAVWAHLLAAHYAGLFDYMEWDDPLDSASFVGQLSDRFRSTAWDFREGNNAYGETNSGVPLKLDDTVGASSNFAAVLQSSLERISGFVNAAMLLEAAEDEFWDNQWQLDNAAETLTNEYDEQLIEICGQIEDDGEIVPDLNGCGNSPSVMFDLRRRVDISLLAIDQAIGVLDTNLGMVANQEALIESLAEIQANTQMSLDELREGINKAETETAALISMHRQAYSEAECSRLKNEIVRRGARRGIKCAAGMIGGVVATALGGLGGVDILGGGKCAAGVAAMAKERERACDALDLQTDYEQQVAYLETMKQAEVRGITNEIDDLLRNSAHAAQIEQIQTHIKDLILQQIELGIGVEISSEEARIAASQVEQTAQRVTRLVIERARAIARFEANPANSPRLLINRLERAKAIMARREGAYSAAYRAMRAAEFEMNRPAPQLRRELGELRSPTSFTDFVGVGGCLSNAVDDYETATLNNSQGGDVEISLRNDIFGLVDPRYDPVTGETASPAEQFRALLRQPGNHLQDGTIELAFAIPLILEGARFSKDLCDLKVASLTAQVVGDYLGDAEITLRVGVTGASHMRRCETPDGALDSRQWIEEYNFGEVYTTMQAGANSFPEPSTTLAGFPAGGDRWVVQIRPASIAPSNADLNIESISDIVLKIDTAGRDRTTGLEGFEPSCF